MDEIILVDKPADITSFGVVARVRRALTLASDRKVKVGHAGTLDPFATGLLILGAGRGTKRLADFLKLDKVYEATIRLGATSTTGDPEGDITPTPDALAPDLVAVEAVMSSFLGEITQTPPIYSAIKIHGQPAYKLARKGQTPDIPPRKITIYDLKIENYAYPELKIRVHCSSGTYIRTLAEDIGKKLSTGAYLTALRRTKIGDYSVESAKTLAELTGI